MKRIFLINLTLLTTSFMSFSFNINNTHHSLKDNENLESTVTVSKHLTINDTKIKPTSFYVTKSVANVDIIDPPIKDPDWKIFIANIFGIA